MSDSLNNSIDKDDDDLSRKLLACCENAYLDGLSSREIFNILRSQATLGVPTVPNHQQLEDGHSLSGLESKSRKRNIINSSSKSVLKSTTKLILITVSLTILAVVGHITVCQFLNVNPIKWFPSIKERRCILPSHPLLMEMVRPIANCSVCRNSSETNDKSGTQVVNELTEIPSKESFKKIAYSSRPIIVRQGAFNSIKADNDQVSFTFEKLKEIFESEPKGVDTVSEECQFLPFRSPFNNLRDAFDRISDKQSWSNPWYIGWSNCHPGVASKLRKIVPRPSFIHDESGSSAIDWIFIGSPGLGAAMHIDYVRRPSWQAQLSGVKTWNLRPPPECEGVCPDTITFTIYPGDLLFLETNTWYHQTFIEGDQLSISIGSEYD